MSTPQPLHLVWFKRDLRICDHAPLREAAKRGPTLCLYVYEPEVYGGETFDGAHLEFLNQSLLSLEEALARRGGRLIYQVGEMPGVLEALRQAHPLAALYAHEETGDWTSFARDRRVRAWARARGVPFHEFPSSGVVRARRLPPEGWREHAQACLSGPPLAPPRTYRFARFGPYRALPHPLGVGAAAHAKGAADGGRGGGAGDLDALFDRSRGGLPRGHLEPGTRFLLFVAAEPLPRLGQPLGAAGLRC